MSIVIVMVASHEWTLVWSMHWSQDAGRWRWYQRKRGGTTP